MVVCYTVIADQFSSEFLVSEKSKVLSPEYREEKVAFWLSVFLDDGHFAKGLCDTPPVGVQGGSHLAGTTWLSKVHSSCQIRNMLVDQSNYYEGYN